MDTLREAVLLLDRDLRVLWANRAFYESFGLAPEEVEGHSLFAFDNGLWNIPEMRRLLDEVLAHGRPVDSYELTHEFERLGWRVLLLNIGVMEACDGLLVAVEDATARQEAERDRRASETRFQLLVQNATEYALFMMDPEGRIVLWNPGAERLLGWTEEEALGQPGAIIFTPEQRAAGIPEQEMARAREASAAQDLRWHVRKDGRRFWGTGIMTTVRTADGAFSGYAKILRDDTERKEAQDALEALNSRLHQLNRTLEAQVQEQTQQVRDLAAALTLAEQEERNRLADVLHDDLQQILYGLGIMLGQMRTQGVAGEQRRLLDRIAEILEEAKRVTQRLTAQLSPPVLKDEGLEVILQWLAYQMETVYGLHVEVKVVGSVEVASRELRVILFQTVRELLFNVVKHATTDHAIVEVTIRDGALHVQVRDDGAGFNPAVTAAPQGQGGRGLESMRERLHLIGGRFEVDTTPGGGTCITITIIMPLDRIRRG